MQNKDKNYQTKIILLAIFATLLLFQFIGITYSLISLYVEQRNTSSISDSLQQGKLISVNQTNKFVQTFLNLVKSGKIAFYDTGDSIKIAQIVQKGVPSKLGNNDIRNATKGAEILSETKDGQQALERAGISPNGKKFQEGHGVYEDTILPNNSNVKIAEGEIPIVSKEQYSAGEAKYLTRLEDAQKQQIQDSSLEFARWTKENVSQEGVIAGSFVPPIIAKAEKIEVLNSSGEVIRTITPSESTKNAFMEAITRNPKDADILIQSGSKEAGTLASREIAIKDLPEGARSAFATGQETVKLDVIQTDRPISLWRVTTSDGESHLVPAIDDALASKTLMAPTSNLYSNKAMKFNSDFETLWNTAKTSGYSDEELFDTTKKMFKNHLESNDSTELAKNIDGLLERNSISPQLKDWLKKAREDPELFLEKTTSEGESSLKATGSGAAAGLAAIGWGDDDISAASTETPTVAEPRSEESIMSSIPYTPSDELVVPTNGDLASIPGVTGGSEVAPTLSWESGMHAAERALGFGTTELPIGLAGMGWMAGLGTAVAAPFVAPEVLTAAAVAGGTLMAADGIKKMVDDPTILKDLPGFVWQDMKDAYDAITNPQAANLGDQPGAPEAIVPPSQEKIITDDLGSFSPPTTNDSYQVPDYRSTLEKINPFGPTKEDKYAEVTAQKYEEERVALERVKEIQTGGEFSDLKNPTGEQPAPDQSPGEAQPGAPQATVEPAKQDAYKPNETPESGPLVYEGNYSDDPIYQQQMEKAGRMLASEEPTSMIDGGPSPLGQAVQQSVQEEQTKQQNPGFFQGIRDYLADIPERLTGTFGFKKQQGEDTDYSGNPKTHDGILKEAETGTVPDSPPAVPPVIPDEVPQPRVVDNAQPEDGSRMGAEDAPPPGKKTWWDDITDIFRGKTDENGQRLTGKEDEGDRTAPVAKDEPPAPDDYWDQDRNKYAPLPTENKPLAEAADSDNRDTPPISDEKYQTPPPAAPLPTLNRENLADGNGTGGSSYKPKDSQEAEDMLDRIFEVDPDTGEVKLKKGFENDKAMEMLKGNVEFDKEKIVDAKIKKGGIKPEDREKYLKDNKITVPNGTTVQDDKNRNYTADENPNTQNPSETNNKIDTEKVKIIND